MDLQSTGANTKIHQLIEVFNRQSGHRCVTFDLKNKSRQVTNKPCECSPDSSKKSEIVRVSSFQHPPFVYGSFGMCFLSLFYILVRFAIYISNSEVPPILMALGVVKTWVHHGNHENRVSSTRRRNEAYKASTLGKQKKEIQISYERFPKELGNNSLVNNFFKPLKQTFFSDAVSQ